MLIFPNIDPVFLHLGPFKIHWYGMMYVFAFIFAWFLANWQAKRSHGLWNKEQISDLIFYAAIGVIAGGRLGYIFFYDFSRYLHNPLEIFAIWQGGMSFHGGFIGVMLSFIYFGKKYHKSFAEISDFVAPLVPIGLGFGRLGNFINGELWGRVTTMPWGMLFPQVDDIPRHPSQLYELFFEGIVLFIIVFTFSLKPRPKFAVSSVFLLGYGILRFFIEFFREPDIQLGFVATDWMTMGQVLSIPMVIAGTLGLIYSYKHKIPTEIKIIKDFPIEPKRKKNKKIKFHQKLMGHVFHSKK